MVDTYILNDVVVQEPPTPMPPRVLTPEPTVRSSAAESSSGSDSEADSSSDSGGESNTDSEVGSRHIYHHTLAELDKRTISPSPLLLKGVTNLFHYKRTALAFPPNEKQVAKRLRLLNSEFILGLIDHTPPKQLLSQLKLLLSRFFLVEQFLATFLLKLIFSLYFFRVCFLI